MWRPWGKSTARIHSASSSPSPSSPFSCSSFKDIQTLCSDEPPPPSTSPHSSPSPRKPSVFHRVRLANSLLRTWSSNLQQPHNNKLPRSLSHVPESLPEPDGVPPRHPTAKPELSPSPSPSPPPSISIPGAEQGVVVYYTSLRVVRRTFEDCKSVRSILRGFRVAMDERDVSMDSGFLSELQSIMGQTTKLTLPRVFIDGRCIGGAEEVKQLNEIGELKKLLESLPVADSGDCHVCGGHRFVLCDHCDGSRKVYTDKTGFKACTACNEHGLIRCPSCFSTPLS